MPATARTWIRAPRALLSSRVSWTVSWGSASTSAWCSPAVTGSHGTATVVLSSASIKGTVRVVFTRSWPAASARRTRTSTSWTDAPPRFSMRATSWAAWPGRGTGGDEKTPVTARSAKASSGTVIVTGRESGLVSPAATSSARATSTLSPMASGTSGSSKEPSKPG